MARSLIKIFIYIIVILFLIGLMKINQEINSIRGIKSEEFTMSISKEELQMIKAQASTTLNSTNNKSELKCPEFKNSEIFSDNLTNHDEFIEDFQSNEFNKRYLKGAMKAIRQAVDNAPDNVKLVKTVTILYKGVELKIPFSFE